MIKNLIVYFTILGIIKAIPFDLNYSVDDIITTSISITPNEEFSIFSFECLAKQMNSDFSLISLNLS